MTGDGISVRGLSAGYLDFPVIHDVSFGIERGSMTALLGPNGAGKSTLLKILAGQLAPSSGEVILAGRDVFSMSDRERSRSIASLFALPGTLISLKVRDFVALGRFPHREKPRAENEAAVAGALEECGIAALAPREVAGLSEGERQLVHLAHTIAQDAPFMVLDEPVAHLDLHHASMILSILRRRASAGKSVIIALHDLNQAIAACDNCLMLAGGKLIADGRPERVITADILARLYGSGARLVTLDDKPVVLPGMTDVRSGR